MKVLLINYEFPPVGGGAGNATYELSRALVELGHEPVVMTAAFSDRKSDQIPAGVRLLEIPSKRHRLDRASLSEMASFVCQAGLRIRRVLRTERPDVMWAFFSIPCGPIAWWGWRATRIPYLVLLRGGDVPGNEPSLDRMHRLLRPLRHAVMRNARAVVANSEALRENAARADPFSVNVVPNGINPAFWSSIPQPITPGPRRYLFVGRLQAQKNLELVFEILGRRKKLGESFELHIVGDGPLRAPLASLALRVEIADRLRWHGWMTKEALLTRYRACHVLVNLSRYEGMPNTVLEAAACGLALWLSDIPEHRELCREGATRQPQESGWLVAPSDIRFLTWTAVARKLTELG